MLYWFRLQASRVAATLLVSVGALGGSLMSPHPDDCHDAVCRPVVVAHDASAHQMSADASGAESHPLHCLVCHWARAFRPRTEARIVSLLAVEAGTRAHVEIVTVSPAAPIAQPSLRSPPASPVLG